MRHIALVVVAVAALSPRAHAAANASFTKLADRYWDEILVDSPENATSKGIHTYDKKLTDYSPAAVKKRIAWAHAWRDRFAAVDKTAFSRDEAADLEAMRLNNESTIVWYENTRDWQRHPRVYTGDALGAVYLIVKRNFAPAPERLASVIARENAVPTLMASARANLRDVPKISIELALEELPSNIEFLQKDTVQAFAGVKDAALQKRFAASTATACKALADFGEWLKKDMLPKAKEDFAIGADAFGKKLAADEGITEPLDKVLARGEAELARLRGAFVATAKKIDPSKPAQEVQASLAADHGKPETLIADTQAKLAGLRKFLIDKSIVTVPSTVMPIVQESPPFMRAFTLASMDTPGPYEKNANEAYYNVTLPDPKWSPADVESYMRGGFSRTIITMVSIHEAFPGHYVQFLWMPEMRSRTRKMYGCSSNVEGWAHYAEQMMIDEGVAGDDPKQRLAQLQEALLRAARYVVGIRMHTRGMTVAQAAEFFQHEGLQSKKVAEMEAKRGTEDPTYLYYTYGKLQILALRDEYKKKLGAGYSLRKFHDAFLSEGALPLPLMRRALLE
ncbi:MAG TPA: DUF885 domain-containing protein [Polyangia bacterium]|jgi:uncharacterized protein (DUF885 family)